MGRQGLAWRVTAQGLGKSEPTFNTACCLYINITASNTSKLDTASEQPPHLNQRYAVGNGQSATAVTMLTRPGTITANNPSIITTRRERLRLRSRKSRNSRILTRAKTRAQAANGLRQPFPFMKLPPELRLTVYEVAIRSHLEDIERTTILQCSTMTEKDLGEARKLMVAEIMDSDMGKPAQPTPYLGVLALLHTSKLVYRESCNIMHNLADRVHKARFGDGLRNRLTQASRDRDAAISCHVFLTSEALMEKVQKSISNARSRSLHIWIPSSFHSKQNEQAAQSAPSTTNPDGSTDTATGTGEDATRMAALKYLPDICAGIQRRIEGGAGVRTSFKAEVRFLVGRDIIDHDVDIMIKGVAALGASLKVIRRKHCSKRLRGSRVAEHKSRAKRHRSSASCDSPRTWLSADEMDTGP